MKQDHPPVLGYSPAEIVARVIDAERHVLLFGQPGTGKSTLARETARSLGDAGRRCLCIGADPGSPAFGIPGAVCLGEWRGDTWHMVAIEALCSLDAGRFRLPLVGAVRRLVENLSPAVLLVDAPGVVRGTSGAELLTGIVEAAAIDRVLAIVRAGQSIPLPNELHALGVNVSIVHAAPEACRPGKRSRARERTGLWDSYLRDAEERSFSVTEVKLIGTPPPRDVPQAWPGRQVALQDGNRTVALGEVIDINSETIRVRMPRGRKKVSLLLVRDAQRDETGLLGTSRPFATATLQYIPPPDVMPYPTPGKSGGPRPVARVGSATVSLVNGIFGDPLLHLRLRHQRRSLLFDLGESGRLPTRIAHQVTEVFISHAHIDHIGGFLWLLRSRIGNLPPCRLFGPPGLAGHIEGLINGIHWDRIGDRGPQFEIAELHGQHLLRFRIQAGQAGSEYVDERPVTDGVVVAEAGFRVRATTLDHGTPVLAFAFEPAMQINIRKERLSALALTPGPWLTELKRRIAEGASDAPVMLPDGSTQRVGLLAEELVLVTPGRKLVYATDLADSGENRIRLTALAAGAHTFFCEAAFAQKDAEQAMRTGHLTARACGEIAAAANVERLVPFHFSRRYEKEAEQLYEEIADVCSRVVVPDSKWREKP